jgi:hypothetical protein
MAQLAHAAAIKQRHDAISLNLRHVVVIGIAGCF